MNDASSVAFPSGRMTTVASRSASFPAGNSRVSYLHFISSLLVSPSLALFSVCLSVCPSFLSFLLFVLLCVCLPVFFFFFFLFFFFCFGKVAEEGKGGGGMGQGMGRGTVGRNGRRNVSVSRAASTRRDCACRLSFVSTQHLINSFPLNVCLRLYGVFVSPKKGDGHERIQLHLISN